MKQSINKFFVGFLFVLAIALIPVSFSSAKMQEDLPSEGGGGGMIDPYCIGVDCWGATITHFGETQIDNSVTHRTFYTFNLDKKQYTPGEGIKVLASAEFASCANTVLNIIMEGQISGQPNHYTIINENIRGGYGVYGSRTFTPPFEAPSTVGNYLMNIKSYIKVNGVFVAGYRWDIVSKTPVIDMEIDLPFTIVNSCGSLDGYTQCANEGETCAFSGTKNVAYGKPWLGCVFQDGTDGLLCNNTTFGFDPIPGMAKSCYFKPDVVTLVPSVTVYVNGVKAPADVDSGSAVEVTWNTSPNVVYCKCTYPDKNGDPQSCGAGSSFVGRDVISSPRSIPVEIDTKFTVTCND